jgi:hypothetical protein
MRSGSGQPILQDRIGYLLKRPVGRPPNEVLGSMPTSPIRLEAAPQAPFKLPEVTAVVRATHLPYQNAGKEQKIHAGRGSSGESQLNIHLGAALLLRLMSGRSTILAR